LAISDSQQEHAGYLRTLTRPFAFDCQSFASDLIIMLRGHDRQRTARRGRSQWRALSFSARFQSSISKR